MPEITVAILDKFHPHIKTAIAAAVPANWTALFIEESTLAARAAVLRDADIAFVMAAPMPKELLAEARRLRFIQKLGAGVDRIDLDVCRSRGIGVARLHAGNSIPVAEHTVLLMLAIYRQLPQIDRRTRAGAWNKEDARGMHRQLQDKTVGLVGFGAIGKEVANGCAVSRSRSFTTIRFAPPVTSSKALASAMPISTSWCEPPTSFRCTCRCCRKRRASSMRSEFAP